jgi:hypothetical protein
MDARWRHAGLVAAILVLASGGLGTAVVANHSWSDYHWARTTPSFALTIVNSTTTDWDGYVNVAVFDWTRSSVVNMQQAPGSTADRDRLACTGPTGQVRICNMAYGETGWLGVAGIWIDSNGHITAGYTKLNDTYFAMPPYDGPAWKQSVTCQELGHTLGLAHQDEDYGNASLFSCMDYQDPPHPGPDDHDLMQLEAIYAHRDAYDSLTLPDRDGGGPCTGRGCAGAAGGVDRGDGASSWGVSLGRRSNTETFVRFAPDGSRHITLVTWVAEHDQRGAH